jgi:hypothetical protein
MTPPHRLSAIVLLVLLIAACSSASSATTPPSSTPSAAPAGITTPEAAAARVGEVNPTLAGIGPRDPDIIGACCFWTATPLADGFRVEFEVGWGDCPAGCIDRHHWTYTVASDGSVQLVAESGPPVPAGVPREGGVGGGDSGGGILPGGSGIAGQALAGPTCPVVTEGDPACDPRPLVGVTVLVLDVNGTEIARLQTDADGRYVVTLPAGPYTVEPQPAEGTLRMPEPIHVTVGANFVTVDLEYDTGIR